MDLRFLSVEYSQLREKRDVKLGNGGSETSRARDVCNAVLSGKIVDTKGYSEME